MMSIEISADIFANNRFVFVNDSEFFGKVISVHWAKNSQKQAILGK
jgi:hypothetical protein